MKYFYTLFFQNLIFINRKTKHERNARQIISSCEELRLTLGMLPDQARNLYQARGEVHSALLSFSYHTFVLHAQTYVETAQTTLSLHLPDELFIRSVAGDP